MGSPSAAPHCRVTDQWGDREQAQLGGWRLGQLGVWAAGRRHNMKNWALRGTMQQPIRPPRPSPPCPAQPQRQLQVRPGSQGPYTAAWPSFLAATSGLNPPPVDTTAARVLEQGMAEVSMNAVRPAVSSSRARAVVT
ncbi:hypothetical protein HaLaN_12692 [Haematococcus lacustris]|uniref:Uncharacterized protein n=1 Tax=Haematococcus lacustris TaxID=44745 RepID=A0A699Z2M0_HAELA|nr:hypothetical protein HaLaN_12692 [Haematococcus lacustris]